MKRLAFALLCLVVFVAGFASGGYAFIDRRIRQPLPVRQCTAADSCLGLSAVRNLLVSAGLQATPGWMPQIVAQSPQCIGILSPEPAARIDYTFLPTRDIHELLAPGAQDQPYVMACIALMRQVADARGIKGWRIYANGAAHRDFDYLHFHLLGD
jgi:hypothetical protein